MLIELHHLFHHTFNMVTETRAGFRALASSVYSGMLIDTCFTERVDCWTQIKAYGHLGLCRVEDEENIPVNYIKDVEEVHMDAFLCSINRKSGLQILHALRL